MKNLMTYCGAIIGLFVIVLSIVIVSISPSSEDLADGFQTPIIAFEFAQTPEDLAFLSGFGAVEIKNRQLMDTLHMWDMAYPFAYGGFLILLLLQLANSGHSIAWIGVPIAVLIIPFDINENMTLLSITQELSSDRSIAELLPSLHNNTWLKWGAIGLTISILSATFVASKEYWSAVISLGVALCFPWCWLSGSDPLMTEVMSLSTLVFFLFFIPKAIYQSWRIFEMVPSQTLKL